MTLMNGVDTSSKLSQPKLSDNIPEEAFKVSQNHIKSYPHSKKVGNYLIGKNLGEGSFAKVKEGLHVITGEKVAVKIISKEKTKTDAYVKKNLRREGRILQQICHINVVHLYEVLETENSYYLILELCKGGDMMDYIVKKSKLTENETRKFIRQIILAIDYMHKLGILHRDLKIENLLLTEDRAIKIIDFGLSNMVKTKEDDNGDIVAELCKTQCGSPAYAAPEVLSHKPYGPAVDAWSIGVNMFAMLTGNLPFTVKPFNIKVLCQKMMTGDMNQLPKEVSKHCKDLLLRFLNPDPEQRIKLRDAMRHPWISDTVLSKLTPSPFPNKPKVSDLHKDILQFMTNSLGMKAVEITRHVIGNTPGHCLATYQLLLQKCERLCQQKGYTLSKTPRSNQENDILTEENKETEADIKTVEQLTSSPEPAKRTINLTAKQDIPKPKVSSSLAENPAPTPDKEVVKHTFPFHVQRRDFQTNNKPTWEGKTSYTPVNGRPLVGIHPMKETVQRDQTSLEMPTTKERTIMAFSTPKKERILSFDVPSIAENDSFSSVLGLRKREFTNLTPRSQEKKHNETTGFNHRPSEYQVITGQGMFRMPASSLPEVFVRHSRLIDKEKVNSDMHLVSAGTTPVSTPQPRPLLHKAKTQINENRLLIQRAKTDNNKTEVRVQHFGNFTPNKYARVKLSAGKVRPPLYSPLTNGSTPIQNSNRSSNPNSAKTPPYSWRTNHRQSDENGGTIHTKQNGLVNGDIKISKKTLLSADFTTNGHATLNPELSTT